MIAKRLRASAVCLADGHLLVVRLRDPVTGAVALYPPGGAVEPGETPAETARRETLEETGVAVAVDEQRTIVLMYPFRWDGVDREVTTHYFAARLVGPFEPHLPKVIDASYNLGAEWVPVDAALEAMRVNPAIADATARILGRASTPRGEAERAGVRVPHR